MKFLMRIGVCAFSFALAGCGTLNSIFYTFDANNGNSISIDVKQRVVLSTTRTEVQKTTKEGGATVENIKTTTIVCAEPSPDALSVYASSASASAQTAATKAFEAMLAQTETGAFVGLRTQTIQLLRDGMYRLCEGYMSGALTEADFHRLQRRYQHLMMGLLAIEQLTGALAVRQVVLSGGSATASSANRAFKKAEDDFIEATLAAEDTKEAEQTANTAVDGQKKALDAVKGDSEKTKVEQAKLDDLTAKQKAAAAARRQADERLKLRKSDYERAKTGAFVAVGGGASADAGGPTSVVVRQSAQSTKELADAVANIVSAVIGTGFGDEDCNTLLTSPLLQTTSLALEAYLRKCAGLSPAEAKRAVADTGVQEAVKDAVNKIQTMRFFTLP